MCRWMAWVGKPVLEELRFNTQHGIVDQSLRAPGRARSLFASADVEAVRRLHPDNPRFERLGADDRIVSEPFSDLPGVQERPFRVPTLSVS